MDTYMVDTYVPPGRKKQMTIGIKHDDGKVRFDLIPPQAIWELGKVYTMGAVKYEPRNWEKGMKWGRVLSAAFRHLLKWMGGEENDKESGLHHLAHCAWCCLTLITYEQQEDGEDDRNEWHFPKYTTNEYKETWTKDDINND